LGAVAEQEEQRRLDVNWAQLIGGALAAVTSAVLLSTVGVAGTLIGAALGSVAVTLGSSVYSYYLEASQERMAAVRAVAFSKALSARQRRGEPNDTPVSDKGPDTETTAVPIDPAEQEEADRRDADEARAEAEREATAEIAAVRRTSWRDAIGRLRWKHVAAVSLAVFALAVGAILAFEVLAGKPVSSFTGGTSSDGPRTSIPFGRNTQDTPQPEPTETETPTESPTAEPTSATPTTEEPEETETPTETPTEETETPTETETATPHTTTPTSEPGTPLSTPDATPEG
jgi:cell division septation protein DedD